MKKAHKPIARDASLDRKKEHVSSEIKGKLGSGRIDGKGHSKLKMPGLTKTTQESGKKKENLAKKDKHVSSEIKGKLGSGGINGKGHAKLKTPCLTKTTQESGKKNENLAKKEKHVSSENKGRLGNRSGGEGDCNAKTLPKINKRCETGKSTGSLNRKEEHVSLKNEGKLGNRRSNDEGEPHLMALSKKKKQPSSRKKNQSLDNKDEHGSSEKDEKKKQSVKKKKNQSDPNLKMPSKMKKSHKFLVPLLSKKLAQKMRPSHVHEATAAPFHKQCGITPTIFPWVEAATTHETIPFHNQCVITRTISSWVGGAATTSETISFNNQCVITPTISPSVRAATTRETISYNNQCGITPIVSPWGKATTHETIPFNNQCGISSTISHGVGAATTHTTYKLTTKKKIQESGKRTENLHKKDKHVSSENNCGLGNSGSVGEGDCNLKTISNRKKRCEPGKSDGSLDRKEECVSSKNEGRLSNSMDQDRACMDPKKSVGAGTPGHQIGKLFVSNTEIAKGSSGTIILEGSYEGRSVAVKRLVRAHSYIASQEIQSLRASDGDPNIVRLYGAEQDQDFMYLALERCACSLDDLIRAHSKSSGKSVLPHDPASNAIVEYKMRVGSIEGMMQDVNLWRDDGHPSPLLLKLMRGVVSGLVHLHRSRIIHRDLKPQNILITKELCAKLSDMAMSRLLPGDTSSSEYHVTGASGENTMLHHHLAILANVQPKLPERNEISEVAESHLVANLEKEQPELLESNEISKAAESSSITNANTTVTGTQHFYKNQLQVFAQKRSLALPIYCSEHEGPPNARRFRCKVSIDGRTYETPEFYNTLKEAEYAAARIALMSLSSDTFHEVDYGLYKNLLREFTQKQGHCLPVYETVRCDESHLPIFVSTVKIEGESFTGKEARSKRMAETSAAKIAYAILKERTSDCGKSGLQASEKLCPVQQTSSVDAFGLGCVLFFCVTGGRHPFGDSLKGESNTEENTIDLSPVEFMPEAADLLARLLNQDPNLRPKASEVLHHPLFWNSNTRLSFLREISDWAKSKGWGTNSEAPKTLESIAQHVFDKEWKETIDCEFMKHMLKFTAYKFKRVQDLLRFVRNTFSHYREFPLEIQEIIGSSPKDLDCYFTRRFPRLLIETYRFVSMSCEPSAFPEYFNS